MIIDLILLVLIALFSLWTVLTRSLLRSIFGFALASVVLTLIMFHLKSPLAAVFELSICAGLITVIFIATLSLTKPYSQKELLIHVKGRIKRYWYLPVILIIIVCILIKMKNPFSFAVPSQIESSDVRDILWNLKQFDLIGIIIILLTGLFGIVILFKEKNKEGK